MERISCQSIQCLQSKKQDCLSERIVDELASYQSWSSNKARDHFWANEELVISCIVAVLKTEKRTFSVSSFYELSVRIFIVLLSILIESW